MNVNPEAIRRIMKDPRGSKILAALLAHEWLHTTQTKIDDKAGYTKQGDMLDAFIHQEGGEDDAPPGLKKARDDARKKASSYAFFLPGTDRRVNGFGRALSGDAQSEYLAFAATPELLGNTGASLDTHHFSLQMQHPLGVTRLAGLEVPSGNEVLYVGGIGSDGTT